MGAVTSIKVTVDSLSVRSKGGAWTNVATTAQTFDLLELRAKGTAELVGDANLKAGSYDQMEINISKVMVMDASGEHEAKLPSSKLRIDGSLEVKANATATADFDFIADQSLHVTGNGKYILAPVIHLEAKSEASVSVNSDKEVNVSGGKTTADVRVGTDIEGSVDIGLRINSGAELNINSSGKIVQTKGEVMLGGTVKSVDEAKGTVTIHTASGNDVTLQLSGSGNADLGKKIGAEVIAQFNAETKAVTSVDAKASASGSVTSTPVPTAQPTATPQVTAQASATVKASGTLKAVDMLTGSVTIATQSGADLVLKLTTATKVTVNGATPTIAALAASLGSKIDVEYDSKTMVATSANIQGQAQAPLTGSISMSGTLKSVDMLKGTVTVVSDSGIELVLSISSASKMTVGGSSATAATLMTKIGSKVTVEYNVEAKTITSLKIE